MIRKKFGQSRGDPLIHHCLISIIIFQSSKGRYCANMRVPDGLTSSSGLMVLRMHSDMDHSHTLPYFSAKYVSYSETAGGSKGHFTPNVRKSKSEKHHRTSRKDQRMNDKRQRNFRFRFWFHLV